MRHAGWVLVAIVALVAGLVTRAAAAPNRLGDDAPTQAAADDSRPALASPPNAEPDIPLTLAPPVPVRDLVSAAYRAAGVGDDPIGSWSVRSRLTGLVPQLSVHVGRGQSWRGIEDPTLGYREGWDVRATWHLDRLLFDPNEMRIASIAIDRRRERRRVAELAIHTYVRWLVADEAIRHSTRDTARWAARRDQLLTELDVLTEGWASAALSRSSQR